MALTLRSSPPTSGQGPSPLVVDMPSNFLEDDLLILAVIVADNVVVTVDQHWVMLASTTGHTTGNLYIYTKIASNDEPSFYYVSFTGSGNATAGIVAIGADSLYAEAYLTNVASTDAASSSKVWGGVTNTVTNTLLLCFGGFNSAASTPDGAMTERWDTGTGNTRLYLMTQAVAASGATGTRTATGSSVNFARTITVSVKEGGSSPTYPVAEANATEAPVFVEVAGEGIPYVTEAPVFVEFGANGVYITSNPAFIEFGANGVFVTSAPVMIEFEEHIEPEPEGVMAVRQANNAGTRAMHTILPSEVTGYALDPEYSWWTVIVPEETENLIMNPSFEVQDTGGYDWIVLGWDSVTVTNTADVGAARGAYCVKLVGSGDVENAEFWYEGYPDEDASLTVGPGVYTWSLDIYAHYPDSQFELEIRYNSGTTITKRKYTRVDTGWKRYQISYAEAGIGTLELVFRNLSPASLGNTIYYLDGYQFEQKPYSTTYCDGDMVGFYDTQPHQSFYWKGEQNRSRSVRRANTGAGGREVSFSQHFGIYTTGIIGLGMGEVEEIVQKMANGKSLHRGVNELARTFTIVARVMAESWTTLSQKRNHLIKLVRPNNTPRREQMLLRYQPTDDSGIPYGVPLEIACVYTAGLQGNITNLYQETVSMQFSATDPRLSECIDSSEKLFLDLSLPSTGVILRDVDMEYQNIGSGGASSGTFVKAALVSFSRNGTVVVAIDISGSGTLTFDGISRTSNVLYGFLDAPDEGWFNIGPTGNKIAAGSFYEMDSHTDNGIYTIIVGDFSYTDGSDFWNNIAAYNMRDGLVLEQGLTVINNLTEGLNAPAWAVEAHNSGEFYIGGEFTDKSGESDPDYMHFARIRTFNDGSGSQIEDVLGGTDGNVYTIRSDKVRYVYLGGDFTTVYAEPDETSPIGANNIAAYDVIDDEWVLLGSGVNDVVRDIEIARDGSIYIIGDFEDYGLNNIPLRNFGKWNGYAWDEPFDLSTIRHASLTGDKMKFKMAPDGILWFYSQDPDFGFQLVPGVGTCWMFGWRSGIFYAPMHDVRGGESQAVSDLKFSDVGEMLISFVELGSTSTRVPYLNRVNYYGTADAYTKIVIQNGNPQFVVNHTVNAGIFFTQDAVLSDLERLTVAMSSVRSNIFTNLKPDASAYIQSGPTNISSFRLMPGENRISVFMRVYDSTNTGDIIWRNAFWGIDAAVENELLR